MTLNPSSLVIRPSPTPTSLFPPFRPHHHRLPLLPFRRISVTRFSITPVTTVNPHIFGGKNHGAAVAVAAGAAGVAGVVDPPGDAASGTQFEVTADELRFLAERRYKKQAEVILTECERTDTGQLTDTTIEQLKDLRKKLGLSSEYAAMIEKSIQTSKYIASAKTSVSAFSQMRLLDLLIEALYRLRQGNHDGVVLSLDELLACDRDVPSSPLTFAIFARDAPEELAELYMIYANSNPDYVKEIRLKYLLKITDLAA